MEVTSEQLEQILQEINELQGLNATEIFNKVKDGLKKIIDPGSYSEWEKVGLDINSLFKVYNGDGYLEYTLLHTAAWYGYENVVLALLASGAHINIREKDGHTPLHFAALTGRGEIVQILLDSGANVNEKIPFDINIYEESGDRDYCKFGCTPLHYAVWYGHEEVIDILVQNDACIDARDRYGRTPLHFAALTGRGEIVQILINGGANVNEKVDCDVNTEEYENGEASSDYYDQDYYEFEWTPLYYAAHYGHKEVIDILIWNGANIHEKDAYGNTILHFAFTKEIAEIFVENNVNAKNKEGNTPLHQAVKYNCEEVVRFLIQKGAKINEKNCYGVTPLELNCCRGSEDIGQYLIDSGADVNIISGNFNTTPLHAAVNWGNEKMANILIKAKANVNVIGRSVVGTPLHGAAHSCIRAIQPLLDAGANPFLKDENGRIPSEVAQTEEAKVLLKLGEEKFMAEKPENKVDDE